MPTYKEFRPTGFDTHINFDDDREDWLVCPCGRNRDSQILERCNFDACLEILGGESDTVEVHRFGHWAVGWFEVILVSPTRSAEVEEIERSLADYPILDEDKYSDQEWTEVAEYWASLRVADRVELCQRFGVSIFAARRDDVPGDDCGAMHQYLAEGL